jgi:putative transposase
VWAGGAAAAVPSWAVSILAWMPERTGYRFRLYPNPEQAAALQRWAGCARVIWNAALEQRRAAWRMNRTSLRYESQGGAELSEAKRANPWLSEPHADVLQQTLRDLDRAHRNWWAGRAGSPRFKRKGRDRFRIQSRPGRGEIAVRRLGRRWGEVRVPKLGWVRFRWSRRPVGQIKHLTVSRDALGWHVSLCCERQAAPPAAHLGPPVGLDRGVTVAVADSAGGRHELPPLPGGQAERLRRLCRRAGRQETARRRRPPSDRRRSRRHRRTLQRIARLRAREARIRRDFLHRLSTDLAKSHGLVAIERLNVRAMTRSASGTLAEPGRGVAAKAALNRAILASGWGELARQLAYKCERAGAALVEVPAHHSSQQCAECGAIDARSRRGRQFACVACGHEDDADINGARVILARALEAQEDGGRTVRRSAGSPPDVGRGREPRTPARKAVGGAAADLTGIPRL